MCALFDSKRGIFDTVLQFFREDDWKFQVIEGKPIIRLAFQGESGAWRCYAQAREKQEQFLFYSVLDTNVPPDKRHPMAEFLTRANYTLVIGNFEMDFNDGEVRYKTSIDVAGDRLTPALVKNMVYLNVIMMDKYLPGIMSVIYAGASPEDAIAKIEGK